MGKIFIWLLSLGLCGCATTAKFDAKLNSLLGQKEEILIAAWGVPDKEYLLNNGKKAIEYARKDTVRSGGHLYAYPRAVLHSGIADGKPFSGVSTQYVLETTPVQKYNLFCNTSFIINSSGEVESWHHEGNNCISR